MRPYDLSPLFRSTVGFDNVSRLLESAMKMEDVSQGYPPYNIEKRAEDKYRISMAVAGFGENDLSVVSQEGTLVVTGRKLREEEGQGVSYLHRGIATRAFERRFQLEGHIKVIGASLKDGLLHIDLAREVPEAMKPRVIKIAGDAASGPTPVIENDEKGGCCGGNC